MLNKIRNATDSLREVVAYYILLLLVSAGVFSYAEGYSFWESLYWAGVTSSTLGYGDINPTTLIGRIDALITAGVSVFIIVPLIVVHLVEQLRVDHDEWSHEEQEKIKQELAEIKDLLNKKI